MKSKPSKQMSLRAYSKHRGVALNAVQKAIETGRISKSKDGKIDPVLADQEWEANTDPAKQRKDAHVSETIKQARAARMTYQAKLAQLEYQERVGELLRVDVAEREAFEAARAVRDALLNVPNRIASDLAALAPGLNPARAHSLSTKAIVEALEGLSRLAQAGRLKKDKES